MGVPHHPINKPPPDYLCWWDAVKDQMLARGYISDNWHFPDAEFQQIVEGIRRLKPACDELSTESAANNMASMQDIDEAVLELVKYCGKKLANTIRTNNHVPPPGPGVPPAQVIVRPMLLPLNAPRQCQWSIATAVVPNAGPVGQNAPLANAPGPAQNIPAPPANAQAQNIATLTNVEFVTGRTWPRKTRAPGPFPRPAPLNGLGRGVFFGIPCPCPRSGPRPTHTPDGSPLKMGGNKRGPVQGMSAGGPRAGAGWGLP